MKRWLIGLVALGLAVVVLAGCSAIGTIVDTQDALQQAGFNSVRITPKPATNDLDVSVSVGAPPAAPDVRQVASIVWQHFHERFNSVNITVHGSGPAVQQDVPFAEMVLLFGPRPAAWNATTVKSSTTQFGLEIVIGVVVLVGLVAVIIVLTRRRNRRGGPPWPGGGGYPRYPGFPGWGPGGGYQGGYQGPPGYPGPSGGPGPAGGYGGPASPPTQPPSPPGPPPPPAQPPYRHPRVARPGGASRRWRLHRQDRPDRIPPARLAGWRETNRGQEVPTCSSGWWVWAGWAPTWSSG